MMVRSGYRGRSLPRFAVLAAFGALVPACAPGGGAADALIEDGASTEQVFATGDAGVESLPAPRPTLPSGLRERIDAAMMLVDQRDIQLSNGFWTVFHGILGQGLDLPLTDAQTGRRVNAVEHISKGGEIRGMRFIPTEFGLDVQMGPTFVGQGHMDQFVAEMIQVGMPKDHAFLVHGKPYTLMDFVRESQSRVRVNADQELSWAIIVIGECVGTDARWKNRWDEPLAFEDLVRYELDQDIENAACGGTHRLFGLAWVRNLHLRRGGADAGVWREIAGTTARYADRAREFQNSDGSFSTNSFRAPGHDVDLKARVSTTGHILEWLALALDDEPLNAPWVRDAADALSRMILDSAEEPIEGGALYHAVHGLRLFRARLTDAPGT